MRQPVSQSLSLYFTAPSLIGLLEELALNAWPSLQTVHYDGWVLRFANGYTRRANSVNPVFSSSLNVDDKIQYCEDMFRAHDLPPTFKMTPHVYPQNLDDVLARKWYREDAFTSTQTPALAELDSPTFDAVTASEQLTDEWLAAYCRLNRVHERHVPTMTQMLNSIVPRHTFMALFENGQIVSVGLAVLDRGYVGLFDIVTDEQWRNRGFGSQLALHLLNWGQANGAAHAYLQVMVNNAPACRLYEKLGFREVYQYWYRIKA